MKISRPDISNAVCELSRHMHNATTEHVKALNNLNKYILNTADKGIQLYHSDGHLLEIIIIYWKLLVMLILTMVTTQTLVIQYQVLSSI